MTRGQIITLSACFVLLVVIYLFGNTIKPKDVNAPMAANGHAQPAPEKLDIEAYIADVNAKIEDKTTREQILSLTAQNNFRALVVAYQKLDKPLAVAWFSVKSAQLDGKEETYVAAGDYNAMLRQTAPDDKARKFLSSNAITCYEKAVEMDSSNTNNRIRLAGAYVEDGEQPMRGVMILRDIVQRDSNNVDAQLMLGRFGMMSGQIDKAIARFEKILYLQPENTEALLMMAEAYDRKGDKKKALELLEKCRKTVREPGAKKEIDQYIQNLKKASS
jgi:tetratricopeptide (TPR) repeat protein